MGVRRRPIFRRVALLAGFLAACALPRSVVAEDPEAPAPAPAEDPDDGWGVPETLDLRIKKAIERGVRWLQKQPRPDGSFGPLEKGDETTYNGTNEAYTSPFGATALAMYTLMKCGVDASDPQVKKGLAWLKKSRENGTAYETAMELLAVTATADPFKRTKDATAAGDKLRLSGEYRAWADSLLADLLKLQGTKGWRYWGKGDENKGGNQDVSSTQLAALALFAAERCGLKVAPSIWADVIDFALDQQTEHGPTHPRAVHAKPSKPVQAPGMSEGTTAGPPPSGGEAAMDRARGFAYVRDDVADASNRTPRGSTTACGIGILTVARFSLMSRSPKVWAQVDATRVQEAIYDGLAWLDRNWSPWENAGGKHVWNVYYVYCVERAMDLVGSQRLGKRFWYAEMAEQVVGRQRDDGSWTGGATTT